MSTRSFPADVRSVRLARGYAKDELAGESAELIEAAVLAVSELATNAIRHAASSFDLTIDATASGVRIEVADRGSGQPALADVDESRTGGRGLHIVDALAESWGWQEEGGAKRVWLILARPFCLRA